MKILLHTCCAPCLIYPLEVLRKKDFTVTGFFYNPNIYPPEEYEKRKEALEIFNQTAAVEMIYPQYKPEEYSQAVFGKENSGAERCPLCWALRLEITAQEAKKGQYDYFSTTLLVSPHQNHIAVKSIAESISRKYDIAFYYEDFRPGYRQAHNQAKEKGIYCQKYCGCRYSL